MRSTVVLLCVVAAASAVSLDKLVKDEWESFKSEYKKTYKNQAEDSSRMKIYTENARMIAQHNQRYTQGLVSYSLKQNMYGDMPHQEFVQTMNRCRISNTTLKEGHDLVRAGAARLPQAHAAVPTQVDWRQQGAITPVKNQGSCGSCWAFSAVGALEAQHYRKNKQLVDLSEQNLVDCSTRYGNYGCNGGFMNNAFRYIKDNGGIATEKSYPYEGVDRRCRYNPKNVGAVVKGFVNVPAGDETMLMQAVATIGPVSVAIDASKDSFQFYSNGVFFDRTCSKSNLNHAVLVVGYGTDQRGGDYWLVKNSWGRTWGDHGYIKMARNKDNHCGIASMASYPLV